MVKKKITKKERDLAKKKAELEEHLAHTQLKHEAELKAEAKFGKRFVIVEGQPFPKRQIDNITREWQRRRIIY